MNLLSLIESNIGSFDTISTREELAERLQTTESIDHSVEAVMTLDLMQLLYFFIGTYGETCVHKDSKVILTTITSHSD
jgi:hypothetical protein